MSVHDFTNFCLQISEGRKIKPFQYSFNQELGEDDPDMRVEFCSWITQVNKYFSSQTIWYYFCSKLFADFRSVFTFSLSRPDFVIMTI